jgi:polyhydroxybutyrate depolymerase
MNRRLVATVLVLASAAALDVTPAARAQRSGAAMASGDHTLTVQHGGRARTYLLHIPLIAESGRAMPLVLAFHGGGGEAEGFKAYAGLDAVSDREGFIVAYPNGSGVLPRRLLTWNAGECCGFAMNQRLDDVGFAVAVIDDVTRRTAVDARRVYATGHSNGAMLAYRLGAERADRIAAIAPVAGAYNLPTLAAGQPVSVLHIHSVDDPRALYNGGDGPPFPGTAVRASHRPVMAGLERWLARDGCSKPPRETSVRKGRQDTTAQTATLLVWDACTHGTTVAHWKLTGVGHGWPGTTQTPVREELIGPPTTLISAAEEVWKFFAQVRR